jgi:hypothetical protein
MSRQYYQFEGTRDPAHKNAVKWSGAGGIKIERRQKVEAAEQPHFRPLPRDAACDLFSYFGKFNVLWVQVANCG